MRLYILVLLQRDTHTFCLYVVEKCDQADKRDLRMTLMPFESLLVASNRSDPCRFFAIRIQHKCLVKTGSVDFLLFQPASQPTSAGSADVLES